MAGLLRDLVHMCTPAEIIADDDTKILCMMDLLENFAAQYIHLVFPSPNSGARAGCAPSKSFGGFKTFQDRDCSFGAEISAFIFG